MNVTVKLDDELVKLARHRAVDRGLSLSKWLGELIKSDLKGQTSSTPTNLLQAIGKDELADIELHLSGDQMSIRAAEWE
ncbi:MAG: hypothetical protein ACO3N7_08295 [Kiritimatiellia bacterium]